MEWYKDPLKVSVFVGALLLAVALVAKPSQNQPTSNAAKTHAPCPCEA